MEGTHLTLEQSERILAGQKVPDARPDDAKELLNYKKAFELVDFECPEDFNYLGRTSKLFIETFSYSASRDISRQQSFPSPFP